MRKPIGVKVNLPTTEAGMAKLREAVKEMNGQLLACGLRRVEASREAKLAYIESLGGIVPWAGDVKGE